MVLLGCVSLRTARSIVGSSVVCFVCLFVGGLFSSLVLLCMHVCTLDLPAAVSKQAHCGYAGRVFSVFV